MKDVITLVLSILLTLSVVFVTLDNNRKAQEINALKSKYHNDSIQLVEYRTALDTFFTVNFKAAQQYMSLVEQNNIK